MIEFKGELTGNCKKFLISKQIKLQTKVAIIVFIIFVIPIITVSVFWNPIALFFLIPLSLYVLFCVLPPGKEAQKIFMPKLIFLDLEEKTIVHICEKMERFHMIENVESVIDYGEWYDFTFEFEDRDLYFVCQKSLLTQGTLEEFEALFEGKIERRIK